MKKITTDTLTKREKNVLTALHLSGGMQKTCTGMNQKARLALLESLIDRGYLTTDAEVTPKGIEAAAPKF